MHLFDYVISAQESALNVYLRYCRPIAKALEDVAQIMIVHLIHGIHGLILNAQLIQHQADAMRETAIRVLPKSKDD